MPNYQIQRQRITETERALICHALDLAKLVEDDSGIRVRKVSGHYVGFASWYEERTPSLHIYPPGVGRYGERGWTWKHFGTGQGGDAVSYLMESRSLDFVSALSEARRMTGSIQTPMSTSSIPKIVHKTASTQIATNVALSTCMTASEQGAILEEFYALLKENADSCFHSYAFDYLADRGISKAAILEACNREPLMVSWEYAKQLVEIAKQKRCFEKFIKAGIIKPQDEDKPDRLAWWDDGVMLPCLDPSGTSILYLTVRRLDPHQGGKYINLPTMNGAVRRTPFGLPSLRLAANQGDVIHLVEGPITALGGISLGMHCTALLGRPGFADYKHGERTSQGEMLAPMLSDLARCRMVAIVPDNDQEESKSRMGLENATELVRWLRIQGIRAELKTMDKLGFADHKDLADAAQAKGTTKCSK